MVPGGAGLQGAGHGKREMSVICPKCGARLVEVVLPPERIVACPNRRGGCGRFAGYHWFPQLLRVR
ncbi:hypothetical protein LCGC14_1659450 [marine sediment metagenome]|uniref:Uncharacterized protein n=1 Tax=marine sediment metagenome TaxID=412755 RepID=A0A0F9HUK4_9ZZZZ